MPELTNPHDKFFKELLGQPATAADFLTHYLPPAVVARLDLSTVQAEKDSFIDDELRESFSDLLYRVRRNTTGEIFVYILFEHKSAPDEWVAFQLLRYLVRFWEKQLAAGVTRLPAVLPLVFYHGRTRWTAPREFSALVELDEADELRRHTPEFAYLLCDLSAFSADELKGAAILRAGLSVLKYIFSEELGPRLAEIFSLLRQAPEQSAIEFLRTVLLYLSQAGQRASDQEVKGALKQAFEQTPDKGERTMQNLFQEWIDRGVQQGLLQGLQQGRQTTLQALTQKQLQHRFGQLAEETQQTIATLSAEQLELLAEALLDFQAPSDLQEWLRAHAPAAPQH